MRYAGIHASVLLIGALGCAENVAAPMPDPPGPLPSWMSATAEGEAWNPFTVTARREGNVIVFVGDAWPDGESTLTIRLYVRQDVGLGPQEIGASSVPAADVIFRPWYTEAQAWTASGANGSGTLTLETLTADRATGTFSFTATARTPATNPQTYRVTKGSFSVRF